MVDPDTEIAAALLEDVDGHLTRPIQPWHAVLTVKSALEKLRARRVNRELTNQLRRSNRRLLETKQALQGQNKELLVINERLRLLHNAKQTFGSMVVHDLRTPLSATMGALALLQMDSTLDLNDRQKETMNGALAAGQQMVRLIDALLDLRVDISHCVDEVVDEVVENRLREVEPGLVEPDGAAEDRPHHIAPALVRGDDALADGERQAAGVVDAGVDRRGDLGAL